MKMKWMRRHAALSGLLLSFACGIAGAAELESKPLHIVVPFAAGGTADVLARHVADLLSNAFKQQFSSRPAPAPPA